jgi:hypothetical protein
VSKSKTQAQAERIAVARAALEALPWQYADEARRIFNITVPLLEALECGYIAEGALTDEGLCVLLEQADSCVRVARYLAEGTAPEPGRAFGRAWEEQHLEQCRHPGCSFTVHAAPDAATLAAPATSRDPGESLERHLAETRTAARDAEAEAEARRARIAAEWRDQRDAQAAEAETWTQADADRAEAERQTVADLIARGAVANRQRDAEAAAAEQLEAEAAQLRAEHQADRGPAAMRRFMAEHPLTRDGK